MILFSKQVFLFAFFIAAYQLPFAHAQSQLKITTARDTVELTKPFTAKIQLKISDGAQLDSSQSVCVIDSAFDVKTSVWIKVHQNELQQAIAITPFEAGELKIIATAKIKEANASDFKIINDTLRVFARYAVDIDTMKQILPIKDIEKEPTLWQDFFQQYALPVIFAVLLGLLFWFLFRQYKKSVANKKNPVQPNIPPYKKAISTIEGIPIPNRMEEIDGFFNAVSNAVRQALYEAENIFAFQNTTFETVRQLQQKKFSPQHIEALTQILSSADMVKFAQLQPPQLICADFKTKVLSLLNDLNAK